MTDILTKLPKGKPGDVLYDNLTWVSETGDIRFSFDETRFPAPSTIRVVDDVISDENGFTIKGHWEKGNPRLIKPFFLGREATMRPSVLAMENAAREETITDDLDSEIYHEDLDLTDHGNLHSEYMREMAKKDEEMGE